MAEKKPNLDVATQLVHAGERMNSPAGQPTANPIYASSTYTYETMDEIDKVFGGELPGYVYSRHGNLCRAAFENALLTIEGGATACLFSSGMAALHAAMMACEISPGTAVLTAAVIYGGAKNL